MHCGVISCRPRPSQSQRRFDRARVLFFPLTYAEIFGGYSYPAGKHLTLDYIKEVVLEEMIKSKPCRAVQAVNVFLTKRIKDALAPSRERPLQCDRHRILGITTEPLIGDNREKVL